jgi:hypothetical protein
MTKNSATRTRVLGILVAAALLTACGGSQSPLTPSAGMNAVVAPERQQHERLAYVGLSGGEIDEFRFPKGERLDHPIADSASGMCSRTDRGDFWVTDSSLSNVEEFRAGGTKVLKTLTVTSAFAPLGGCAIDKSSGDLAVSLLIGGIVIFKSASGSGTPVDDGLIENFFIGYDGSGDLFADGFTSSGAVGFVEMPAGSSTFHAVSLPNTVEFPGDVQWDGTYITVEDQEANAIYRYSVSGSAATLEGTVNFSDASDCAGGDIFKGKYYLCPDAGDNNVKVYAYPAGGTPIETWKGPAGAVDGIVIEE